jgi:DNA modification methylase
MVDLLAKQGMRGDTRQRGRWNRMGKMRILVDDTRKKPRELPEESVHRAIASPPYVGLRDYGTAKGTGSDHGPPASDESTACTLNQ